MNNIYAGKMASGKTYKIFPIVEDAIKNNENLIIFDAKEEYISKFNEDFELNNYSKYIINLNDFQKSDCYNPLKYPYELYKNGNKDDAYAIIEKLGRNIFADDKVMDDFWISSATNLFIGLVMGLFEDAKEEEINLLSVWNMMLCFNEKYGVSDYITKYVKTKGENNSVYNTLSSIIFAPSDTKGGIISTARQKLQFYINRSNLIQILANNEIEFEKLFKNKTVFIIIPDNTNTVVNNIAVSILEQLLDILYSSSKGTKIILDNFDMIEKINNFNNLISFGPSRGIDYVIATRSIDLLYDKYTNYINTIANIIECNEQFELKNMKPKEINYPKLKIEDIKTFDIKKYISNLDYEQYSDMETEGIEVKDILKKIDERLKELD